MTLCDRPDRWWVSRGVSDLSRRIWSIYETSHHWWLAWSSKTGHPRSLLAEETVAL